MHHPTTIIMGTITFCVELADTTGHCFNYGNMKKFFFLSKTINLFEPKHCLNLVSLYLWLVMAFVIHFEMNPCEKKKSEQSGPVTVYLFHIV